MTTDPNTDRPEVDDPRVLALAKARQQMAHSNPFNVVCPPWDGLTGQEQQLSLLDARNYLRAAINAGLTAAAPAAVPPIVLREEAARIRAHCPDRLDDDSAEGAWLACHCAVADDMERRLAAEATPVAAPTATPNETGATVAASGDDLIEEYLRFLRGQGSKPDLSDLPQQQREAFAGQFEIVKALFDRGPELPPIDRDPVARRLGLHVPAAETPGPETQPRRGDEFEQWLKAQRDEYEVRSSPQWGALDEVLDTYRLYADTGTPLGEHVCEGRAAGDCECLETPTAETPDAPRREPHPTEADLRHALAVAAKFHGRDATTPAVVAEPGKEA